MYSCTFYVVLQTAMYASQKSTHTLAKKLAKTTNNWLPFLLSQLVLGPNEAILVNYVPCLEKKATCIGITNKSTAEFPLMAMFELV